MEDAMTTRPRAPRSFTAELQRARPAAGKAGAKGKAAHDAASDPGAAARHDQTMAAFAALMTEIKAIRQGDAPPAPAVDIEAVRREAIEGSRLRDEINGLSETIERTKREIAVLSRTSASEDRLHDMTDQLDAVVKSTEQATHSILGAAEEIQALADKLGLHASDDERAAIDGIQNHVIAIFEACNFQDLSGQRISKVVNALKEVEQRVHRMMELFGGEVAIQAVAATIEDVRSADEKLLNGPSDKAKISQDEIDKLFG
jgi:chemotaxis protein CheZ